MSLVSMTYDESYGELPRELLRSYKRFNASPADHDTILAAFGCEWNSKDIPWKAVIKFTNAHCSTGRLVLPRFL